MRLWVVPLYATPAAVAVWNTTSATTADTTRLHLSVATAQWPATGLARAPLFAIAVASVPPYSQALGGAEASGFKGGVPWLDLALSVAVAGKGS